MHYMSRDWASLNAFFTSPSGLPVYFSALCRETGDNESECQPIVRHASWLIIDKGRKHQALCDLL